MIFGRADLSQAESRVVYALSGDAELIRLAQSKPWEFDVHSYVGSLIFNKDEKLVTKPERYATKKISHGTHYHEQPERISDSLLKEGFEFTVAACAQGQQRYLQRFPAIEGSPRAPGYQYATRMLVINKPPEHRALRNSWGRIIRFPYEHLDDNLYRRLYAWRASSEVADLLNQWGFIPLGEFIERHNLLSRINLQVHDEVTFSLWKPEAWDVLRFLRDSLERPRSYNGVELAMPVTFALERRYHEENIEFKRFPEKEELEEAVARVWETRIP